MLRRFISAVAVATAAVLAPAGSAQAAQAHTDHGEFPCVSTFENQAVTVGKPFGFTIECTGVAGTAVAIQISFVGETAGAGEAVAGAGSAELTLDGSGRVADTATLLAPGDYTVQVLDVDGQPLSETYTLTAVEPGSGAVAEGAGGSALLAPASLMSLPYLVVASGILVAGAVALVVHRLRASRQG